MLKNIKRTHIKKAFLSLSLVFCGMAAATSALAFTEQKEQPIAMTDKKDVPESKTLANNDATIQPDAGTIDDTADTDEVTQTEAVVTPASVAVTPQSGESDGTKEVASRAEERARSKKAVVAPQPIGMTQVNEQFAGEALDETLWEVITYPKAYRNNEEQDYRPSQVKVADGKLQITATRDETGEWHSGEVHSKWAYRYGEFEVRMALSDTGQGVWPAAWLMGSTDHWPDNGEIDIFENINGSSTIHGTIHAGGANGHWQIQRSLVGIDVTEYHTYKIIKQPGVMSWWVDGVKRGEWRQSETPVGGIWPFEDYRYFGLLNLAIGGTWPGPSDESTPDVIHMYVDSYTVKNAS